jgi:excisionase family DNA binding protein
VSEYEPIAISIREVARRLQIGKSTAHRLVTKGEIPGFLVGQTWRVLERDFEAYIERKRVEAEEFYRRAGRAS